MKIRTTNTRKQWATVVTSGEDGGKRTGDGVPGRDMALEEIDRVLTEFVRCNNLVIVAGLGTSMCVKDDAGNVRAPTMQKLWDEARTRSGMEDGAWTKFLDDVRADPASTDLEALLSQCKLAEEFGRAEAVKDFVTTAETLIRTMVDFLRPEDELPTHVQFLRRVARRGRRKSRPKLFTVNYDLCFEQAARKGRFVVLDGFSMSQPSIFDPVYFSYDIVRRESGTENMEFIPSVFQLYKLHGSLDWTVNSKTDEIQKKWPCEKPLLIYPRNSKYEMAFAQPYIEMMAALQLALRQPDSGLLVVGFGFADKHIAEPILSAIRSNLALKAIIVDPLLAPIDGESGLVDTNVHLRNVEALIDHGDARLALLSGTFEDVAARMPDLTADTDMELHVDRMRKLRGDTE